MQQDLIKGIEEQMTLSLFVSYSQPRLLPAYVPSWNLQFTLKIASFMYIQSIQICSIFFKGLN
jgi:hypothetical protein